MKALEILKSYTGMTPKQVRSLGEPKSMDEALARKWFLEKVYIYSESRLLENMTPQEATEWTFRSSRLAPLVVNEICIMGEVMYQARLQLSA